MSLKPSELAIPELTKSVVTAAFPKGNPYLKMRDELGTIFTDETFSELFAVRGQPAYSPSRLALVLIVQFAESLSDRQVAEAVRARLDLKYLLALELNDPGFDASILPEFRTRLIEGGLEERLLTEMLELFGSRGLLKRRGKQRTDSSHVLAAAHALNRLEGIGETMRFALNQLAAVVPEWLKARAEEDWFSRYANRMDNYKLPKGDDKRKELAETIGKDGFVLLQTVYADPELGYLAELPAVEALRQVWLQQFYLEDQGDNTVKLQWREQKDLPPGKLLINSPYDLEARYSVKGQTTWTGYKVFLTETCDEALPRIITNVETSHAATADFELTEMIHASLATNKLLPQEHLLDSGFISSHLLMTSKDKEIELIGPVKDDYSWQAQANQGFAAVDFKVDWDKKQVICPQGKTNRIWKQQKAYGVKSTASISVEFRREDCFVCPAKELCTKAKAAGRSLSLRPSQEQHEAMLKARDYQLTEEFKERYKSRAGIEGTISQAVRRSDIRQARYRGLAKTHLQHVLTTLSLNFIRVANWFEAKPLAQTRVSRFSALAT
jgi:transposase